MSEQNIVVQVDIESLLKKIDEKLESILKARECEGGKGEVLPANVAEDRYKMVLEALKRGGIREQWEKPVALPFKPTASLLSLIQQSDAIEGKMGDTVNIPYVNNFDADVLTNVGGSLSEKTGVYGVIQTTLKEAGAYIRIPYADLEKLSENLIASIEAQFENAIARAIDKAILDALIADTNIPELDKSTSTIAFDADWIPEAFQILMSQGRSIKPGDCILVLGPKAYMDLLKDIASTQALAFARPDVVRDGLLTEFMGVKIVVSNYLPAHAEGKVSCYLIHKNAIVFAPKREMLFETERDTINRVVKLTGTYTFGIAIIDNRAIVEIKTYTTA